MSLTRLVVRLDESCNCGLLGAQTRASGHSSDRRPSLPLGTVAWPTQEGLLFSDR